MFISKIGLIGLAALMGSQVVQGQDFGNELSNEVNQFQVQLKPAPTRRKVVTAPRYAAAPKKSLMTKKIQRAENQRNFKISTESEESALYAAKSVPQDDSTSVYHTRDYDQQTSHGLFVRATALPMMAFSTYDGADLNAAVPQSTTEALRSGISGAVSLDLDIFNSNEFLVEAGAAYLQFGSGTGQSQYSFFTGQNAQYYDTISHSYVGATINGKWYLSGVDTSSLYFKGGATPLFLVNDAYSNRGNINLGPARFGALNKFDVAVNIGLGYAFKVSDQFYVVADITGYQGLMPVMANYSVYNAAVTTGLGISLGL